MRANVAARRDSYNERVGTYPPESRLRRRREIDEVLDRGRRASGALLRVAARRNEAGHARFAPVVTKRAGGAVQRNRWKRLLREAFRRSEGLGAFDIVAMPVGPPGEVQQPAVDAEFAALIRRVSR